MSAEDHIHTGSGNSAHTHKEDNTRHSHYHDPAEKKKDSSTGFPGRSVI